MTQMDAGPLGYVEVVLLAFRSRGNFLSWIEGVAKENGLNLAEMIALVRLSYGAASVKELAEAAAVRQNGASMLVDRLVARSLVVTERHSTDRRVVLVSLAAEGRDLLSCILPDLKEAVKSFLSPLALEEQESVTSFLERLAAQA